MEEQLLKFIDLQIEEINRLLPLAAESEVAYWKARIATLLDVMNEIDRISWEQKGRDSTEDLELELLRKLVDAQEKHIEKQAALLEKQEQFIHLLQEKR